MLNKQLSFPLKAIAERIGATIKGDPECLVCSIETLTSAKPGSISFLVNPAYRGFLKTTQASAVVVTEEDLPFCTVNALVTKNPRLSLAKLTQLFARDVAALTHTVHPSAVVHPEAQLHPSVSIGPHCSIEAGSIIEKNVFLGAGTHIGPNCHVGEGTKLLSNVVLGEGTEIGKHCFVQSGTVIGAEGFGYAKDEQNRGWVRMPNLSNVIIRDKVEIGSNTTIDRGYIEPTLIGEGVIIDNLVQIGHNVQIGDFTAIAGCVGIAGSTKIGKHCLLGGGAGIAGHLEIGDGVLITAKSAVNRSIAKPGKYSSGLPAKPNHEWLKNVARFSSLDDFAKRLQALEKKVKETS